MTIAVAVWNDAATGICKYSIAWLADQDGNATGAWPMRGAHVWLVEHLPDPDPNNQPAGLYNMTIVSDVDGADILGGAGVDIAQPSFDTPLLGAGAHFNQPTRVEAGNVTMTVTGAGKGGGGRVILFLGGFSRFTRRPARA
jgi:hypothetical protein